MDFRTFRSIMRSKAHAIEYDNGHIEIYVDINGKSKKVTWVSHSDRSQMISPQRFHDIAREMRLTTSELREFLKCTISLEEWLVLWNQRWQGWPDEQYKRNAG